MIIPSGGSAPRHGSCLAGSLLVRPVRLGVPGPAAGVPGLELWAKIVAFIATVKLPVPRCHQHRGPQVPVAPVRPPPPGPPTGSAVWHRDLTQVPHNAAAVVSAVLSDHYPDHDASATAVAY